jgi:hypothetical protein
MNVCLFHVDGPICMQGAFRRPLELSVKDVEE